jgi:hypothetical protein
VRDIIAEMAAEDRQTRGPGYNLGYVIALLGGALFAISCFLPYNGFSPGLGGRTVSLYQQVAQGLNDGSWNPGGVMFLFGGVAAVVAVAVFGLARRQQWTGLPWLLVGTVAAWSLTWIGFLIYMGTIGLEDLTLEIGFWLQAVSIGVAVIGTILVATRRTGAHERVRPLLTSGETSP